MGFQAAVARWFSAEHGAEVRIIRAAEERGGAMRHYDPEAKRLSLSELLPPRSRRFQLAHQVALVTANDVIDKLLESEEHLSSESRALARVAMANYFAAALLMPYGAIHEAARAERYDIELLAHRFGTSFEQVCHRLTTLRRPGADFPPLQHPLRINENLRGVSFYGPVKK